MVLNFFEKAYSKFNRSYLNQKASFSQCGEDLIIDFLLTWQLGIKSISYLDIGANDPFWCNNTYLFYKRGCSGVNIEPDISLFNKLKRSRPRDINLNLGIGFSEKKELADFYLMSSKALNTFSKEEAERIEKLNGFSIQEVRKIELVNINDVLKTHFSKKEPDFLSIDVEGLDLKVLNTLDFKKYKPKVICVETSTFNQKPAQKTNSLIQNCLFENGYFVYADTFINSIYARQDLF
jgi:FkbM family methyltransferase